MRSVEQTVQERNQYTPEHVKERLLEAVRWLRHNGSSAGPHQMRSPIPAYRSTLEDHLLEGWGIPDKADGVEAADQASKIVRMRHSPARVDEMLRVLDWCRLFLARDHAGDAVILNLWLRCKVYRINFEEAIKERGFPLTRRHAYRMRDRALSKIAQGLQQQGIAP